jgi:hypothetical protein
VVASRIGGEWMPLVGADRARVDSMRPLAQQVADISGCKITLLRFSVREELETLMPVVSGRA